VRALIRSEYLDDTLRKSIRSALSMPWSRTWISRR